MQVRHFVQCLANCKCASPLAAVVIVDVECVHKLLCVINLSGGILGTRDRGQRASTITITTEIDKEGQGP